MVRCVGEGRKGGKGRETWLRNKGEGRQVVLYMGEGRKSEGKKRRKKRKKQGGRGESRGERLRLKVRGGREKIIRYTEKVR